MRHWDIITEKWKRLDKTTLLPQVELLRKITETIDIKEFKIVNLVGHIVIYGQIIFQKNSLSVILDFDRLDYDYPELDVARAIVTWKFNIRLVQAFLESYRKEHLIPIEVLARSLKFLLEYGK